jgi:hypothetical protein
MLSRYASTLTAFADPPNAANQRRADARNPEHIYGWCALAAFACYALPPPYLLGLSAQLAMGAAYRNRRHTNGAHAIQNKTATTTKGRTPRIGSNSHRAAAAAPRTNIIRRNSNRIEPTAQA